MGYGGTYAEAARVTRATADGGIDGIINEDRLGLDAIYVQAKRWDATVGRPEIQKFAGSLEGERARKGVFITTSNFSPDARDYVKRIDKRIVLIDGPRLTDLMIEHGVGVTSNREPVIPRIDLDFLEE
jgi:restriction system protein